MNKTNLSNFNKNNFRSGNFLIKILWYLVSMIFFKSSFHLGNDFKIFLLKIFGANIGKGVVIKPCVNIKYPWNLKIGNFVWLGENIWIDNLDKVEINDHSCISQGAMLLCGNHDYSNVNFSLITKPIILKAGSWICASAIVCPGVTIGSHAVLSIGSVATKDLDPYSIYQGNPASKIRKRNISQ